MKILLTILFYFISLSLSGATYYVSPTGDDGAAGTIGAPWLTWQKAFNVANAGDTVYFRGGIYYATSVYGNNITMISPGGGIGYTGTEANPICYFNYPNETPIFDCKNVRTAGSFNTGINMQDVHYLKFKGLTIRNIYQVDTCTAVGISVYEGTNCTFENMIVHNVSGNAYRYYSMGYDPLHEIDTTRWINCDAYNLSDTMQVSPGNSADGWKVHNYEHGYFYWEGCRTWNCSDDGFDMSGSGVGVWNNCWSFNNGHLQNGDGNGFKIGAVSDVVAYPTRIVTNCISAYNTSTTGVACGFQEIDYDEEPYKRVNARVYNNIAYKNNIGFAANNNVNYAYRNSVYRNNISRGNTYLNNGVPMNVLIMDYEYPESNNSWDFYDPTPSSLPPWFVETDTVTITDIDFVSVDSTGLSGSRKSDGALPDIDFLRLREGSDLIDAGIQIPLSDNSDVTLVYTGASPDMGYAEYSSEDLPAAPIVTTVAVVPSVNSAKVTVNVTDDGGVPVTIRGICWSVLANPTIADSISTSGTGEGVFAITITGLIKNETYYVRGYAINEVDITYGNELSFTTNTVAFLFSGNKRVTLGNITITTGGVAPEPEPEVILVTSINVAGAGGATTITVDGGTLQMYADVSPDNATDTTVVWTRVDGTGTASISATGLLTALSDGTVTVRATAGDGSAIYDEVVITMSNQDPPPAGEQIIADHTVVDRFDDIPAEYITEVKKMLLLVAGESHSGAFVDGPVALEALYPTYACNIESYPDCPPSTTYLRMTKATWGDYYNATGWIGHYGEEDWFTNATAIARTKAGIAYCNTNGWTISVLGFGWCYDAEEGSPTAGADPVSGVHWYGNSLEGPEGSKSWGLDDADNAVTGNSVNMDSYLEATQAYIDYCTANSIDTKIFFTTGPVDSYASSEISYQAYLKWEHMRDYVNADATRILFDYADILCYDDDGTPGTTTWNGHTYPHITATNLGAGNLSHIGAPGVLRLGKAMWWMLARIAGWDGN